MNDARSLHDVIHDAAAARFVLPLDKGVEPAFVAYRLVGPARRTMALIDTEVPVAHRRRGLAALVVAAALAHARREGFKVQPMCSYVAAYMRQHPETQDLLER